MMTASYNRAQQQLWQAERRLTIGGLSEEEQADQEQVWSLAQERLDDIEREYDYRIMHGYKGF